MNKELIQTVVIPREGLQDLPVSKQIQMVAESLKSSCPNIFKKDDPYPTLRMVQFKEDKIVYEITEGKASRAKVSSV